MKPISNSERKKIIEAKERGESIANIIKWFGVCRTSIFNICTQYKETGSYEPKPFPGKQSTFTDEINNQIKAMVADNPSITQEELIEEIGLEVTQSGMSRHMKKLGLTLKKRLSILQENKEKK